MSSTKTEDLIEIINKKYDLSPSHGFLPEHPMQMSIRSPYNKFHTICLILPQLIESHQIQYIVDTMDVVTIDQETTDIEYKMLYCMLCVIQTGYIWHNGEGLHNKFIPKQLSIPLDIVSRYLRIPPILTHASLDLYNWNLIDKNAPFTLSNLVSIFPITGDKSEAAFSLIIVVLEHLGRDSLTEIIRLYVGLPNEEQIMAGFKIISHGLSIMIDVMNQMYELCDAGFFYNKFRIFLAGWTNETLFPDGMQLEDIGQNIRYNGGSAAQFSMIQVFDIFFGVQHKNNFLRNMREYMPGAHRDFLVWLESMPNCNRLLTNSTIIELHTECITKLSTFRSVHMGFIHHYIIGQASKATTNSAIATEGTGGSNLITMLKEFRQETDDVKR